MYDFAYHKPSTIAEAVGLLADPEARPISGGQTLLPALKHRLDHPSALVDLSGIAELRGIRREGDKIVIGAMARHQEIENDLAVKAAIPALAWMAGVRRAIRVAANSVVALALEAVPITRSA